MQTKWEDQSINSDIERSIFIIWSLIVIPASLLGDSIILMATFKYKVIKLHKVIVGLLQHMAVCDVLYTVLRIIPTTVVLLTDRWVLGEGLCRVCEIATWVYALVTPLLTTAMSAVKLIVVKYPYRAETWTTRLGHKLCAALWIFTLVWYAPILRPTCSTLKTQYTSATGPTPALTIWAELLRTSRSGRGCILPLPQDSSQESPT